MAVVTFSVLPPVSIVSTWPATMLATLATSIFVAPTATGPTRVVLLATVPTLWTTAFSVLLSSIAIVLPTRRFAVEVTLMFESPTLTGAATAAAGVPAAE